MSGSPRYGSYSSMGMSTPIEIASSSIRNSHSSCAFPSWPQGAALGGSYNSQANSYLSDDDLLFDEIPSRVSSSERLPTAGFYPPVLTSVELKAMGLDFALERKQEQKPKQFYVHSGRKSTSSKRRQSKTT